MYGYNLPFGPNNAMSVSATKQNAMIAPSSYGGDPYTVNSGYNAMPMSAAPLSGGPLSIQDFRASMAPYAPQPANPYQGMTPFGNHYTRYLMGGGQRQNRLARPYGVPRSNARHGGLGGGFGPASSGYQGQQPFYGQPQPYDSIG